MAFKKVNLDGSIATVPGVVAAQYRNAGFTVVDEDTRTEAEEPETGNTEEPGEEIDLTDIPVSKWTAEQVKVFAEENDISTAGGAKQTAKRIIEFLKDR